MSSDEQIDEEVSQSDLVHNRQRESPIRRWILLDGDRYAIASTAAILVVPALGLGGLLGVIVVTVVFVLAFLVCMLAIDRLFLPGE